MTDVEAREIAKADRRLVPHRRRLTTSGGSQATTELRQGLIALVQALAQYEVEAEGEGLAVERDTLERKQPC